MTDTERDLADTRKRIAALAIEIDNLKRRERELAALVPPVKERCQACVGSGTVSRRDWQSGEYYPGRCDACNGTGTWEQKP